MFHSNRTLVMGIINTTPDSFSDGGINYAPYDAISNGLKMLGDGADILDIGGESTRPGSSYVNVDEELERVIPVIQGIKAQKPHCVISIDTRRRAVAQEAIRHGATIINDVTGFRDDPSLIDLGREANTGMIIMHMLGTPRDMQTNINYGNFPQDIYDFFVERTKVLENSGIDPEMIVIDPGIGFGKTFDQNLILLNRIDFFSTLGKPILIGASRKAFIGKILDESVATNRGCGTLATVAMSVIKGAAIVRVHDVKPAVQVCRVCEAIIREKITP